MGQQSTIPIPRRALVLRTALTLLLSAPLAAQAAAPILLPSAIVYDSSGNLYIAEAAGNDVRKLNPSGSIAILAGTGVQGFSGDNGPAISAELNSPRGLSIAPNGNIYIADTSNNRIREVTAATGIITTIAGTGAAGNSGDHGPATAARLYLPTALASDASGNLYIADTANHRIREINAATGIITTVAGTGVQGYTGDNGPATGAKLDSPQGLATDATGNLYIADTNNHCIREISATTGIIITIAGTGAAGNSGDGGPATAASLTFPRGLSLDASGNLYFADFGGQRIRKLTAATGRISTIAGSDEQGFSGDGGPATAATLDSPRATAISLSGLVTLADAANQRVRQIDASGAIHTIAGPGAIKPAPPSGPTPATIALTPSATSIAAGQPITITANVSAPTGTPTGTVTLYDNAVTLATIPLPPNGQIAYSTTALGSGANTITASYSGDTSFAKSTSSPAIITVSTVSGTTTGGDFTLASKDATTKTLLPGTSASFTFTLQTQGAALSSPITLSASGVPSLYTASFNPSYLPPGTTTGTVTLTIAAKTTNALQERKRTSGIFAVLLFPLTLIGFRIRKKHISLLAVGILLLLLIPALFSTGCGARINSAGENTPTATPYTITVTGTATTPAGTTIAHSTTVTLLIQQSH